MLVSFVFSITRILTIDLGFVICSVVLIPNQGLFSIPYSDSEEMNKKPGGNMARTADPDWQRGYSLQ